MNALQQVKQYSCWELARLAGCADPDRIDSVGAQFLYSVRDQVTEAWTPGRLDREDRDTLTDEIANDAPDVYTYTRWQEFVDLAAWTEDLGEVTGEVTLTEVAGLALYQVASRLAAILLDQLTAG